MDPAVLILSPWLPEPRAAGDRIDIASHVDLFREEGWRVEFVCCGEAANGLPSGMHAFAESPGRLARERAADVQAIVDRLEPALVWAEYAHTVKLADALDTRGAPVWFRAHNFEIAHQHEKAGLRGRLAQLRWRLGRERRKYRALETRMARLAERIYFISLRDRDAMRAAVGGSYEARWLPPLLGRERATLHRDKDRLDVLYAGSNLAIPIHASGADAVADTIAPAVRKAWPGRFRFHVVGRHGGEWARDRSLPDDVLVHGFVEDMDALHADVDAVVVPVPVGWGCKIKLVDGLARGLPVVGAANAFRALPEAEGAWFACETTADYVAAFRGLLDADARERTGERGLRAYEGWREESRRAFTADLAALQPASTRS